MELIRTLIVDDEPLARRRLAQLLAEVPGYALVGQCRNGTEALQRLTDATQPVDLVFLDVQMPDLSGLQVLEKLAGHPQPLVVFVTAYDHYTLQAFEAHVVDYLLKPVDPDRFARCLAHVRQLVAQRTTYQLRHQLTTLLREVAPPVAAPVLDQAPIEQFLIKERGRLYFVRADQAQYLEASGNYVTVHALGQQHSIRSTLSQLEGKLNPATFIRIHRSLIVNSAYIKELRPWAHGEYLVTLHNDTHLTSSRSYSGSLQRFLHRFAH
ncbi:LytR/AlgR family response regulator transcription factor [Hymenobacter wooponensis]|uniref:Response regulator transcription factor n=1 Tax=Hymenobacter wooponensis TaxID=1525360 RepID=A0A4Z0MKQ7_9BACT|nr:LytTR family DNA-binding domain-containing protein [Hymenobacter wooponensis]TGD79898.1 response regulator transcription factor [Hymenobacter wooponensis]